MDKHRVVIGSGGFGGSFSPDTEALSRLTTLGSGRGPGKALDQADANGWISVSMKDDWKSVFPDR